jgi:NADH:ubiquinone oxidoreductase subunit F (NADH-binding)
MTMTGTEAPPTGHRLLAGRMDGRLETHLAEYGPLPALGPSQIVAAAREAGLTGRGGAGFPIWRKLSAVAAAGRPAVVIANAAEGEPASGKDKALLAYQPNLILDGLQLAARATGARTAHFYAPAAALGPIRALLSARRDAVPVTLHAAPDAFVSGEESAVAAAVAGGGAVPRDKLVRITDAGVGGAPTLVQNVETLAHLALIARYGPGWFRSTGTPAEPGTFLATVSGAVAAPGVVEVPLGVRLGDLLAAAGGPSSPLQAVLVGGYHGGWVPADLALAVSREAMAPFGASPGAGVVVALSAETCGLRETARIAGYLASQTAGQCGPCVNGLPRIAATLTDLAGTDLVGHRARPGLPAEVERLARLVTGRGACRHPDGTARLVLSALRAFESDVHAHLTGRCLSLEGTR